MIRVLVGDDHAIVRRGLRQILSETDDIVVGGEAATAAEVLQQVQGGRFHVVVLDVHLPGGNGIDLVRAIRREPQAPPVLILTMYPESQYAVRAIKAGAAGFMTKESAPEQLVEAVRKVAARGRWVSAELAETLASVLAGEATGPVHERLTDRELEIFLLLASGKTVSEIARDLGLSVKTVSTHRTRILTKMAMRNNAELTQYAVRSGLVS